MSGSFYVGDYVHVTKKNTNGAYLVNAYGAITRWKYGKSGNILYQVHFEHGKFKNTEDYFYGSRLTRSTPEKAKAATGGDPIKQGLDEGFGKSEAQDVPQKLLDGGATKILKSLLLALDLAVDAEHRLSKAEDHELEEAQKARDEADALLRTQLDKARELTNA